MGRGPLNVIRLDYFEESDYRGLDALSYSRLSDIEKVGLAAVNAPARTDLDEQRGVGIGALVDIVVTGRLPGIPNIDAIQVKKVPTAGSATHELANKIVDDVRPKKFTELTEEQIKDICKIHNLFKNGTTESNVYSKMKNYSEYIEALSKTKGTSTKIVSEFDYTVARKSIERLRKIEVFSMDYPDSRNSKLTKGEGLNKGHIEYQTKFLATINEIEFKCMLDAIVFDHEEKTITPIDIKTGALKEKEDFENDAYYYWNYYIQAAIYRKIMLEYYKYDSFYSDYTINSFRFVYSTTHPKETFRINDVWIYDVPAEAYMKAFSGFDIPNWDINNKNPQKEKQGVVELLNFYKANVTIAQTRASLEPEIKRIEALNLPF